MTETTQAVAQFPRLNERAPEFKARTTHGGGWPVKWLPFMTAI